MIIRRLVTVAFIACISIIADAQVAGIAVKTETEKPAKPYKILTSGRQVTVKSNQVIRSIMVWTSGGHRVVEQKSINASSYNFTISINAKVFFVMIKLENGQIYTEKIGV